MKELTEAYESCTIDVSVANAKTIKPIPKTDYTTGGYLMSIKHSNPRTKKLIGALLYTPVIFLGKTKRQRRSAVNKWLQFANQATK